MRERHNIVGSEVGHARPPIYFRVAARSRPRPRRGRIAVGGLVLALLVAGGALSWLDQRGAGGARGHDVWLSQALAGD